MTTLQGWDTPALILHAGEHAVRMSKSCNIYATSIVWPNLSYEMQLGGLHRLSLLQCCTMLAAPICMEIQLVRGFNCSQSNKKHTT